MVTRSGYALRACLTFDALLSFSVHLKNAPAEGLDIYLILISINIEKLKDNNVEKK